MIDVRFSTAVQMVLSIALAEHDGFRCTRPDAWTDLAQIQVLSDVDGAAQS